MSEEAPPKVAAKAEQVMKDTAAHGKEVVASAPGAEEVKPGALGERIEGAAAGVRRMSDSEAQHSAEQLLQELKAAGAAFAQQIAAPSPPAASPPPAPRSTPEPPAPALAAAPPVSSSPEHECAVLLVQELRDRAAIAHRMMEEYASRSSAPSSPARWDGCPLTILSLDPPRCADPARVCSPKADSRQL